MRGAAWLWVVGLSLWPGIAGAWKTPEHFDITFDECMAVAVVQPANPARPWANIAAVAKQQKLTRDGTNTKANRQDPANWDEAFCVSMASAAADADVDAFDDDLAHTQTRYRGGVNFIGLAPNATDPNPDNHDPADDPRKKTSNLDPAKARLPPPVQRVAPTVMVQEWLGYFRKWTLASLDGFRNVPYEKDVFEELPQCGEKVRVARVWRIPGTLAHDDPKNPIYALGRLLHQFQDSCAHQGITGYQHSFAAYWVNTNPDQTNVVEPRRDNCTRPLTNAFFQALGALVASASKTELVHLRVELTTDKPRPSLSSTTCGIRVGSVLTNDEKVAPLNIDYSYQLCDQPCRDLQGTGPAVGCINTKLNAGFLMKMWEDAIGAGAETLFTRRNWPAFIAKQIDPNNGGHDDAGWLSATNTAWDQPPLGTTWWFVRSGEMTLRWGGTACPLYGNRTRPFLRKKFVGANNAMDPEQMKCNPNYEATFVAPAPTPPRTPRSCARSGRTPSSRAPDGRT
jgi:hypothetical protein